MKSPGGAATMPQNIIGRTCVVRDIKHRPAAIVEGRIIDADDQNRAKRIRLMTGEHTGEVRMVNEYEFLEFVEHHEAAEFLAAVWPD
jgi:hypothetical protein